MPTSQTEQLPLTASPCVELALTEAQIADFANIIDLLRIHPGSQCFFVLASSYEPEFRKGVLRLQGKHVGKRTATKTLKLLRSPESHQ